MNVLYAQPLCRSLDEIGTLIVDFDGSDILDTARDKLEGNGSRASKQIHHRTILIINIIVENVE